MNAVLMVLIGLAAGVISGMGIGGGTILIPALTMLMGIEQHAAQNVNLIYFIPTAIVALILHVKSKRIQKNILLPIILPGLASALVGAYLAVRMEAELLRRLFGAFLLYAGAMEFFKKPQPKEAAHGPDTIPRHAQGNPKERV